MEIDLTGREVQMDPLEHTEDTTVLCSAMGPSKSKAGCVAPQVLSPKMV